MMPSADALPSPPSFLHPELALRLDAVIDGALAANRIVGAVVIVSIDGRTVFRRPAGYVDRESGAAMRENAIFRLASVSKLVVATVAMVLVGQDRLALDGLVGDLLPWFQPRLAGGAPAPITVRQLLSHTAGLTYGFLEAEDGPYHRAGISDGMDCSSLTLEENMHRLASVPLMFQPGAAWNYSLAIDLIGAIIERVSGQALPDAVRALVTQPLALADTDFVARDVARLAVAYADGAPWPRRMADTNLLPTGPGLSGVAMDPIRATDIHAFPSGGAGMVGTADDVLHLLEVLRTGGAPILPSGLVAEMARDQLGDIAVTGWPGWGHGLGFSVLRDPASAGTPESSGSWRWGGAYGHSWFVDPSEKLTVVALTNTAFEGMSGGGRFPQDICRAIYNG